MSNTTSISTYTTLSVINLGLRIEPEVITHTNSDFLIHSSPYQDRVLHIWIDIFSPLLGQDNRLLETNFHNISVKEVTGSQLLKRLVIPGTSSSATVLREILQDTGHWRSAPEYSHNN